MKQPRYRRRPTRVWTSSFKIGVAATATLAALGMVTIGRAGWDRAGSHSVAEAASPTVRLRIGEGEQRGTAPTLVDYARLDRRLTQLAQSKEIVGLAVAVVEKGELRFVKGYGVTTAGTTDRVTANTVFRWASVSKGVASTMIGKLASEGKLSLKDPIYKWSPSLKLPQSAERIVTVEDVLSHRLGIVKNAYDDKLEEGFEPRVIRTMLGGLDRYCKPGGCFAYQNVGYDAASEVVRSVTKQSYQDAVRQRLFKPLGMTSASVTRDGLMSAPSWARPHVGQRTVQVEEPYYRVPAAGGINSSILDLGTWMRAQMGEMPGVLPMKVLNEIHRARVSTRSGRRGTIFDRELTEGSYALGWRDYQYFGHALVGHRGAVRGYRSMISFDPKTRDGVAVLWNSETSRPVAIQPEVLDMIYRRPFKDWLELDVRRPG